MDNMKENYELAKWLAGEMTESELKAFQQTPEYETYAKIATYATQLKSPEFDSESLYKAIESKKRKETKVISLQNKWWLKIAAVLVLFLGLTFFYKTEISITEYAENGKKTTFILPDNSEVVLNSGSELNYKNWNWDNNRNLNLEGEAYFRVAKGKKFEVTTNLGTVTVLGTQFNVKSRENRFDVTCYEGRVKVNFNKKGIILTPGESVTFENDSQTLFKIDATKPEWTNNELAFNKEKLQNIINELSRQFNVTIEVKIQESNQLFTGTIPIKNIDEALQILSSTYHLQTKKVNNNTFILEAIDD